MADDASVLESDVASGTLMLAAWRAKDVAAGEGEAARMFAADASGDDWIDVAAPGDIYLALHRAGRLPHPYDDRAEEQCAWVGEREWWWVTDVEAPPVGQGGRLNLTFEGLDTFATVWLNGEIVARSDNMFRPLSLDIAARVKPGANRLAIRFDPASATVEGRRQPLWDSMGDMAKSRRNMIRKAQFGWGWDWGPTLPTVGIWKPVTLTAEAGAALRDVAFTTLSVSPARDLARVQVRVAAEALAAAGVLTARIVLTAPDGSVAGETVADLAGGAQTATFDLKHPALWWTPELGKANLHRLDVTLLAAGAPVDRRSLKVGVRTIALDQSPDLDEPEPGLPGATLFRFVLNGVPIFARGACWIPASSFVAEVDAEHYRPLIDQAVDGNMNMLRIWGGGVYEHDAFYDLCDARGVLVWQDFMFACAPYPEDDPAFVDSVRGEARDQIRRLRSHPCLAVWCGNNENQVIHSFVNARAGKNEPLPGDLYYEDILPAAVAELDPQTPYWPGSPYGGPHPGSMVAGDVHDWTVWHGIPPIPVDRMVGNFSLEPEAVAYTRYAEDMSRFVSEYGIQASPAMETLKRSLPDSERHYGSEGLAARIKDRPKNKVDAMLIPVTGLPDNLQDYVDFTQITQAEGLKFGIEHFRRRKPHCSGSLIWQLNDSWPGISWSLIDYYGFGKAGFYYVRRAYAPVMASFRTLEGGAVELWVTNDTLAPVKGEASVALESFAGETRWRQAVPLDVGANDSRCVWRGEAAGGPDLVLTVSAADGAFPANRWFFAPIKDLDRASATAPAMRVEQRGPDKLAVTLTGKTRLWFVHLLCPHEEVWFSDNYIDLGAGETRVLTVEGRGRALSADDITLRWR